MEKTAKVHALFGAASKVTNGLRFGALLCELGAALIALVVILAKPQDTAAWLPLAVLLITFVGTGLRAYSSLANGFAQRCRRLSLRAYCCGKDLDHGTVSSVDDDTPLFVEYTLKKMVRKPIEVYYDPTVPPGVGRQAELYAHSAFFTWRLLRIQAWITFVTATLVMTGSGIFIYQLAAMSQGQVDRHALLEAICTVVLLVIAAKGFEAWWEAYNSYREIRTIENDLQKRPKGEDLKELIDAYDIERASGANPWSSIYWFRSKILTEKWAERRASFVPTPTAKGEK